MSASPDASAVPDKEPSLTAEQYVILAEAQRKKRALAETRIKYNALVDENQRLLEEREDAERNTYEVTEAMRRDIFAKNEKIAELQATLSEQTSHFESALKTQRLELEKRLGQQEAEAGEVEGKLRTEMESLGRELSELDAFTRAKDDLERSQLNMRAENDTLRAQLDKAEQEEERRYIHGTMTLKREFEQKVEELKKRYEEDADERLDSSVKRILLQNRRAAQELQLHIDESTLLQKENKILMDERQKLLQELDVKVQMEQGYVTRNAKQARDNKEASSKLITLEKTLQAFVEDFEKERQFMREQWKAASDKMSKEVDGYRRLVELKMKEAKNIRRLAQEVLLQRSDVETFFVSSLRAVCSEIEREAAMPAGHASKSGSALRSRRPDIAQLTWAQRESVLRLAFAKINNQARQSHFQKLPKHSLAEVEAARLQAADEVIPADALSGLVSEAAKPQLV